MVLTKKKSRAMMKTLFQRKERKGRKKRKEKNERGLEKSSIIQTEITF